MNLGESTLQGHSQKTVAVPWELLYFGRRLHAADLGRKTMTRLARGILAFAMIAIAFAAVDGGIYAELVRNRSFEDSDRPD